MASPLQSDLKSTNTLQNYLNVAIKNYIERDKYQILKVTDQIASRIDLDKNNFDRFTLEYNILNTTFKVKFLFDNNNPLLPPDIILEDNIGFEKICEKTNILNINSILRQWNIKDENCVTNLIQNMRNIFKEYQLNNVIQMDIARINFEVNTLLNICEDYGVMLIPNDNSVYEKIRFVIPVEKKHNSGKIISLDDANDYIYGILLVADFVVDRSSKEVVSTSMDYIYSKKTKNVKRLNKKLPKWEINKSLQDYVKSMETTLDNVILFKTADNTRKEFLTALLNEFNEYILEYDSLDYSYASFFIKYPLDAPDLQYNSIILYFYMTDEFPHHDPIVTIIIPYSQRNPELSMRHELKYHFSKKYFTETPKRYQEAAALFKNYIISNITTLIREYKH